MMTHPIYSKKGGFPDFIENTIRERSIDQKFSRSRLPELRSDEIAFIRGTYDFFGLNFHTTYTTEKSNQRDTVQHLANDYNRRFIPDQSSTKSASDWLRVSMIYVFLCFIENPFI